MPAPAVTERMAELRVQPPSDGDAARKILHAIEGMAASWHKINRAPGETSEFNSGRQQMATQGIGLLLGVGQGRVKEALENGWL